MDAVLEVIGRASILQQRDRERKAIAPGPERRLRSALSTPQGRGSVKSGTQGRILSGISFVHFGVGVALGATVMH